MLLAYKTDDLIALNLYTPLTFYEIVYAFISLLINIIRRTWRYSLRLSPTES